MGLILPVPAQSIWQHNLAATPQTDPGTILTAGGTNHTKAATFTTLIDPTTYDTYGFWVHCCSTNINGTLLDIAIGASTAEVIIVPDYSCGARLDGASAGGRSAYFPIFIPKGSRISARTQAGTASDTMSIMIYCNQGVNSPYQPMFVGSDTYGTNTANSRGEQHTPGNSGAESAAANIGGTTSRAYKAIAIELAQKNATMQNVSYHWELVIGGVTMAEWYACGNTSEYVGAIIPCVPFYMGIPSGVQLQVQAECSGTAQVWDIQYRCFY